MQLEEQAPRTERSPVTALGLAVAFGEVGFVIALPLVVFLVIGVRLDRHFDTAPLFILTSLVVALAASVLGVVRIIRRIQRLS